MRTLLLALVLLPACMPAKPIDPRLVALAEHPVRCQRGDDCEVKWSRALQWVNRWSHWKLRVVSDQMIATEGPLGTMYPAYTIQKVAEGAGVYRFDFAAGCAAAAEPCDPRPLVAAASFVAFVDPQ